MRLSGAARMKLRDAAVVLHGLKDAEGHRQHQLREISNALKCSYGLVQRAVASFSMDVEKSFRPGTTWCVFSHISLKDDPKNPQQPKI
jgi:hypothetical protein